MIEACVAGGAHYMDLTGEIPFVAPDDRRRSTRRAADAGVKVVQVCGFEALPPDLAVLLAAETARERWDEGLAQADLEVDVAAAARAAAALATCSRAGRCRAWPRSPAPTTPRSITDPAALIDDPARRRAGPLAEPDLRGSAARRRRRRDRADGARRRSSTRR